MHVVMQLLDDLKELRRAATFAEYFPERIAVHGVESFGEVDEHEVEVAVLLASFFEHLADREDHVDGASACSETTLRLGEDAIYVALGQSVARKNQ